jgi:pimeloyl-ACP methyl ester carboxylesterase
MTETDVTHDGRVLRVRDAGDPDGSVVMYFHGTPGSRLDLGLDEQVAADHGARLVSFDRPGYGGSTPASFGLESVAHDAEAVADHLGLEQFATLGQSGGGPFALATAAVLGDRVVQVGVASGPGPFQLVPGAVEQLSPGDQIALALLPGDAVGAALAFAADFEPLVPIFRRGDPAEMIAAFAELLAPRDRELMSDQGRAASFATSMQESVRQGTTGAAWDNVAWVGAWDVEVATVACPVLLWYGEQDRMAPLSHGLWLRDHIPTARLVQRSGEGHLGMHEHFVEVLAALLRR